MFANNPENTGMVGPELVNGI